MRLKRLDLARYGKFTDRSVALPMPPGPDFHLILGANEAGKSTLRGAILDLLFGFPPRTPLDFLHPKPDLRLGAALQHGGETLEFVRLKANKNTLRTPDGEPLPDTALQAFLGGAGRAFFDRMFGLDHQRLVDGGNSILNAQDDVGQILFQSAAGLASLGRVRDALQEEADGLWAPTRSSKRAYYIARADMDEAAGALKQATVSAQKWAEAHERVQTLEAAAQEQRGLLARQQARRDRLERIRRVGPVMREFKASREQLAVLDGAASLPPDAAQTLNQAERARALAHQGLQSRQDEALRLEQAIADIYIDDTILELQQEIEALNSLRLQYGAHESAMLRCQGELDLLWKDCGRQLGELGLSRPENRPDEPGGPAAEQALRAGLPGLPARKHVEQLLRERGVAGQALEAAQAALDERQAELTAMEARLRGQPVPEAGAELRGALERAKAHGDPAAAMRKAAERLEKAESALRQAGEDLGEWFRESGPLRALVPPSAEAVAAWLTERRELLSGLRSAAQRRDELAAAADKAELHVRQYRELHHPVTREDLSRARRRRDDTWRSIKSGAAAPAEAAESFESELRQADELADLRHDKAREAAQLQSLQHQWQQADHDLRQAQARHAAGERALADFDARWVAVCDRLGLAGLPLEHAPDWLVRKDRKLEAEEAVAQARREYLLLQDAQRAAADALARALDGTGGTQGESAAAAGARLEALRVRAEARIRDADAAQVRQEAWQAQAARAAAAMDAAQRALDGVRGRLDDWRRTWSSALDHMGLDPATSPGAAEGALALFAEVADKLEQMRRLRSERLDLMQAELDGFAERTARLALAAGLDGAPSRLSHAEAFAVSHSLAQRLTQASRAREQAADLQRSLAAERAGIRAAERQLQEARAAVQPLLDRAGVDTLEALAAAVEKSDRQRALQERALRARERLLQEGDGLTLEQLQSELDQVDLASLPAQWSALQADIEQSSLAQSELAVRLAEARRELEGIAGADDAAQAEARRQDALARMSDAAERYVRVFTAARLLRWAIDRYREEKQGPMLARASAIFAQLTLDSFERLRVDFDRHPMVLEGQRADGRRVGIAGLSDGTRDQLYLALRLAALELHLEQAPALPFIADDLFINYDDARSEAGLRALADLAQRTQVIFLSHHDALLEPARRVFGDGLNVVRL